MGMYSTAEEGFVRRYLLYVLYVHVYTATVLDMQLLVPPFNVPGIPHSTIKSGVGS
jgi:hypothetical protein